MSKTHKSYDYLDGGVWSNVRFIRRNKQVDIRGWGIKIIINDLNCLLICCFIISLQEFIPHFKSSRFYI